MATNTFFVDKSAGSDANDGKDNIGVGLATANWTESSFTLVQSSHGYTFATGDIIHLTGGTGVTTGAYEVASSTSDNIVLVETSTLPRIGNASDVAAGDLANSDITSSDGPFQTFDKCCNAYVGTDDTTFYLRSGTDYVAAAIDTACTTLSQTCTYEGYTTTVGDDGQITMKGTLTDTVATRIHHCFKNIIFDAENSRNNGVSFGSYEIAWRKCVFKNGVQNNIVTAHAQCFFDCDFQDSSQDGISCSTAVFVKCRFYNNTLAGIDGASHVICYNCIFFSNATDHINAAAGNETFLVAINCTFDGDAGDTTDAIFKSSSFRGFIVVVNCIIYDNDNGIRSYNDERDLILNNLMNANVTNFDGSSSDQEGTHVTSAPNFVDEVSGADYALNAASPALGAGTDGSDEMDIGAHQRAASGGSGGGIMQHPGTSGGANA